MKQDVAISSTGRYSYDPIQRAFHWSMAAVILVAICIGLYAAQLEPGTSPRKELLDIHKSLGMTALVLLPLRFVWRLVAGEPAWRTPLHAHVKAAAHAAHYLIYAAMAALPITGYVASGAGGYSLPFFGLFSWPRLVPLDKPLAKAAAGLHHWGAWIIVALLAAHIAAAIWHRWKGDEVFSRMAPGR